MGPICPHCGCDDNEFCTAWDSGFPDYFPGSLCNGCGEFVANDEWEYEDSDDEITDPEQSAANWCTCGLPREVCLCDDWDESDDQMGPKFVGRNDDEAVQS